MIAKNPKVIMTASEYIRRLEVIANENTFYCNQYPFNICMVCPPKSVKTFKDCRKNTQTNRNKTDSIALSADCWNLIKSVLNGYDVNNHTVGYAQFDLSNTGDVGIDGLFKQCTDVSADFTRLKNGEPRLLGMPDHAGSFIGEVEIGGKIYNVIESTGSWERKVLYSYVDESGWRRHYKGAGKNGRWTKHGKMTKWLDYSNATPVPAPIPSKKTPEQIAKEVLDGKWGNGEERKQRLTAAGYNYKEVQEIVNILCKKPTYKIEYTVRKGDTLSAIAGRNATTVAAIMKLNPQIKNRNLIFPGQVIRIK